MTRDAGYAWFAFDDRDTEAKTTYQTLPEYDMHHMQLYIADKTCSQAVQIVANELGLEPELIHYDVVGKSTSTGSAFRTLKVFS